MFSAIYVGCNKGMDAVNALRMGSNDAAVDKFEYKNRFFGNAQNVQQGVCKQELGEQFPIADAMTTTQPAVVHCVEGMPHTSNHLQWTANQFAWKEQFVVKNAAISSTDGVARFQAASEVGNEKTSMCNDKRHQGGDCQQVPMLRLDTYLQNKNVTGPDAVIDLLSIDVEGADADVLLGANGTLNRVRYLEFEYNWKGQWQTHSLQNTVEYMRNHGFVCYWPGVGGRIWRITDCWLPHYDLKFWSNVACVHTQRHPWVANRMEELFLETLQHGKSIQYTARLN